MLCYHPFDCSFDASSAFSIPCSMSFFKHISSIVVSFCLACGTALALGACGQKGPLKHPSAQPAATPAAPAPQPATTTPANPSAPIVTPLPSTPPASGTPLPATDPAPRK
jgi:predicted small lipoprotein YifL